MAQTFEFYDARAKEATAEAQKAELENVRDRQLLAAKTWRSLADQARQVSDNRAAVEQEKAAKRAREAEEEAAA